MKPKMQEDKLYEYAVIRLVPKIEREEFINIGLILFSKKEKYIRVEYLLLPEKIKSLAFNVELEELDKNLQQIKKIAQGSKEGGLIAQFDIPERFRWLTAVKNTMIQTSRPHPGKSQNLDETFERLFIEYVE